jgi:hypothetical protein
LVGRIRPEITRIKVVLPAPLGPITPTASPALTSKADAEQRLEGCRNPHRPISNRAC